MDQQEKTASKTYQVSISSNALQNFDEITGYLAFINHQPINAIKIGDAIFECFEKIGRNPHVFKECEELRTKSKIYRRAVCLSWIIIFKISGLQVIVLGIVHRSRKPSGIKNLKTIK